MGQAKSNSIPDCCCCFPSVDVDEVDDACASTKREIVALRQEKVPFWPEAWWQIVVGTLQTLLPR